MMFFNFVQVEYQQLKGVRKKSVRKKGPPPESKVMS